MQQAAKPKATTPPPKQPVKVPSPKQQQGCELDRLMGMFDKL